MTCARFVWRSRPAEWHSTVGELPIASQGSDTMRHAEAVDQRLRRWTYVCSVINAGEPASSLRSEVRHNIFL